jgi:NADH-quinone oxidoreductase subunit J
MTVDLALFLGLAIIAVSSALGMLLSRSAVYAALYLVLNFATVAVLYVLLSASFIAMTQISVYAGAIMVLFLFVIMLLGTERLPSSKVLSWQMPVAVTLAIALVAEAAILLFARGTTTGTIPPLTEGFGNPKGIGQALFNQYLLPFEITSVLLLVAIVGAIVLSRREKGGR